MSGLRKEQIEYIREDLRYFFNHKYVLIKKFLYLVFLLFSISWIINFRGGLNWLGLSSFLLLGFVYGRISLDMFRSRYRNRLNIFLSVLALLTALTSISGIIMIWINRNYGIPMHGHGVDLTVLGWLFFALLCLIYYSREKRQSIEKSDAGKHRLLIWIASLNMSLAAISVASFPLYPYVKGYIFFLILAVLCFDILAIVILLIRKSMFNSLLVVALIGSFMIVFINSHFRSQLPGGKPKLHEYTLRFEPNDQQVSVRVYLSLYYAKYPEHKFTVPLKQTEKGNFEIKFPSYAYHGYLYYAISKDSTDAVKYFADRENQYDSLFLRIPREKTYILP